MARQRRLTGSGQLLRNFALLAVTGVGTKALGFIANLLLARRLGVAGFGSFSFAQAVASYFLLIADFGIAMLAVRELAIERERTAARVPQFLSARFITTVAAIGGLAIAAAVIPRPAEDRTLILLFALVIAASGLTIDWVFRSREEMGLVAAGNLIQTVTSLALIALLIRTRADLLWVPVFLASGVFARAGFYWLNYLRRFPLPRLEPLKALSAGLLRRAGTLGLAYFMIQIYYNIDTVLLGFYRGDAEVGWYNAAYWLVLAFTGMASVAGQVLLPRLSHLSTGESAARHGEIMRLAGKILLFTALPIALGGTFYSEGIINLLYGAGYENSAPVLSILIWQAFTVFSNVVFAYYLLAMDFRREYLYSVSAGAGLNVALNLLLIPRYGMVGAAATTVAADALVLVLLYGYAQRRIAPAPMLAPLLKAAVGGGAFAAVALAVPGTWAGLLLASAAYVVGLMITMPFSPAEWRRMIPWRAAQ